MPRITLATIGKLLLACLVVGFLLSFLELDPVALLRGSFAWIGDLLRSMVDNLGKVVSYTLLGAVIVVPIWLLSYAWRALKNRR